jgi:hypothetical protein
MLTCTQGMKNRSTGGHGSEMSHPIDMISQSMYVLYICMVLVAGICNIRYGVCVCVCARACARGTIFTQKINFKCVKIVSQCFRHEL